MALILVVDDTPANRELLRAICHYGGHQTLEAASAEQALALTRAHHPHLIITDVHMLPTSGLDLLDTLKHDAHLAVIPVIVTTVSMARQNEVDAYRLGAAKFLAGPLDVHTLTAAIAECLHAWA
jgi:CheY-like chemotaxis protein